MAILPTSAGHVRVTTTNDLRLHRTTCRPHAPVPVSVGAYPGHQCRDPETIRSSMPILERLRLIDLALCRGASNFSNFGSRWPVSQPRRPSA